VIRINRPRGLAPAAWLTKAEKETQDAIDAYKSARQASKTIKAPKTKAFEFKYDYAVYGDALLRHALNTIYHYKCAYCESMYGATQPVAVEHWRPKGEVIEGGTRIKPGYYWLGAAWENLLPSCTDCNSPRRQIVEAGETPVLMGKGNHFPLVPGTKRAKRPGQEKDEQPLLLNPEVDDPDQHLEFVTDRARAGVIRATLINGAPSPKGAASIEVYALDRPQLTQARAAIAKRLRSHLRNTRYSQERHLAQPQDAGLKKEYDENMDDLAGFLGPSEQYAAMARQLARAELPGLAT
jgi:hypothetical protein